MLLALSLIQSFLRAYIGPVRPGGRPAGRHIETDDAYRSHSGGIARYLATKTSEGEWYIEFFTRFNISLDISSELADRYQYRS